jgi:hypothetical protein
VIVLQHLFWMAAQDVDVPAMERIVHRIHALVAAHQYAAAAEGAAPLQHMLRMTAAGEWLGGLPAGAADPWREAVTHHEAQLGEPQRAELAWLNGVLGAARGRPDMLGAARQQLRVLIRERSLPNTAHAERSEAVARMLDTSL